MISSIQQLPVPLGERLQVLGAAAATEDQDPEHRHQQQEALPVTDPAALSTVRDSLEEADQNIRCGLIACGRVVFGHWGH
jgi:hypothetical protein